MKLRTVYPPNPKCQTDPNKRATGYQEYRRSPTHVEVFQGPQVHAQMQAAPTKMHVHIA